MKKLDLSRILTPITLAVIFIFVAVGANAQTITFQRTDEPGRWFKNLAGPIAGTQSLSLANPVAKVTFIGNSSHAVHTVTSLLFPAGAAGMPFDAGTLDEDESVTVTLT